MARNITKKLMSKDHPHLQGGPKLRFWGTRAPSNEASQDSQEEETPRAISRKDKRS